jgi:hypothetical protein
MARKPTKAGIRKALAEAMEDFKCGRCSGYNEDWQASRAAWLLSLDSDQTFTSCRAAVDLYLSTDI